MDGHGAHGRRGSPPRRSCCPALGFALGPIFEDHERALAGRRPARRLHRRHLRPEGHQRSPTGSARRARRRSTSASATRSSTPRRRDQYNQFVAISTRCMHLGCPVSFVQAAQRFICPCHGGVYDFSGKVAGGPPVRPLDRFYTRVTQRPCSRSGPASRSTRELRALLAPRPGEPLDGIGQYLYPSRPSVRKIPGTCPCPS